MENRRKTTRERLTLWLLGWMDIDVVARWLLGRMGAVDVQTTKAYKALLHNGFDATKRKWRNYPEHEQGGE